MIIEKYKTEVPFLKHEIILNESYKKDLINNIKISYENRDSNQGITGKMSSYDLIKEKPIFTDLYIKMNQVIDEFYPLDHIIDKEDANYTTRISEMWFVEYKKNQKAKAHTHNSEISFCYYLKADINSSPIIFPHINLEIKPYDNLFLVFPGLIKHKTLPQNSDNSRIVIAGNSIVASFDNIGI